VSAGKVVWAIVALALSYGFNESIQPTYERDYDLTQHTSVTGKVTFPVGATNAEVPLVNAHIVTIDVQHVGKRYSVRELSLVGPPGAGGEARSRIFVALPGEGGVDLGIGLHDPQRLKDKPMSVLAMGKLGSAPSYVEVQAGRRDKVVGGKLLITSVEPYGGDPVHLGYSAQGRLDLDVETSEGLRMYSGAVVARLIWDEG
jgi:hypothetical protein